MPIDAPSGFLVLFLVSLGLTLLSFALGMANVSLPWLDDFSVDLPDDLPVLPGAENTEAAVDFETVTQLRGRVASRLSADGVCFEQLDPASARMRTVEPSTTVWL